MRVSPKSSGNATGGQGTDGWSWWDSPAVTRSLRLAMGLLLVAEAVLAGVMTFLVWYVTRDASLFPTPSRHAVSVMGLIAGTTLLVYCAVLALVTLGSLGKVTALQQRLRRKTLHVHMPVAAVACGVWLWTLPLFDLAAFLAMSALLLISYLWSRAVVWTLAPRLRRGRGGEARVEIGWRCTTELARRPDSASQRAAIGEMAGHVCS